MNLGKETEIQPGLQPGSSKLRYHSPSKGALHRAVAYPGF